MLKRNFLTGAMALAAAPMAGAAALRPIRAASGSISEHYVDGGMGGIVRARYGYTATGANQGFGIIKVTKASQTYMVPLTVMEFDEADGQRLQLLGDGCVTVMQTGLYNLTMNFDWPAQARGSGQDGYDVGLRSISVQRAQIGVAPPTFVPGKITLIPATATYDVLAAQFTPGSSSPSHARASYTSDAFSLAPGQTSYLDVVLPASPRTFGIGDSAQASHTTAPPEVVVTARMIGTGLVRLWTQNLGPAPVTVPSGQFNVMSSTMTTSAGNSADAWTFVNSGALMLLAGEKVFATVRSETPGDFLQITNQAFVQLTALA
jgi:hypothetical protein